MAEVKAGHCQHVNVQTTYSTINPPHMLRAERENYMEHHSEKSEINTILQQRGQ